MPNFNSDLEVQLKRVSSRVWQMTDTLYDEIERLMNAGYYTGKSAQEIKFDLLKHLKDPTHLTSDDVEELLYNKKITESQASKINTAIRENAILPKGVYRSQIKNAFRLARTEINMSYHNRDYENRQKLPFVIGIKVWLSSAHGTRMPNGDMCDNLKGKYPANFIFSGWHTACMCYTTSILAPKSELRKFYRDENPNFNYVKEYPKESKAWISKNSPRINKAKSKPFWVTDNKIKT